MLTENSLPLMTVAGLIAGLYPTDHNRADVDAAENLIPIIYHL